MAEEQTKKELQKQQDISDRYYLIWRQKTRLPPDLVLLGDAVLGKPILRTEEDEGACHDVQQEGEADAKGGEEHRPRALDTPGHKRFKNMD